MNYKYQLNNAITIRVHTYHKDNRMDDISAKYYLNMTYIDGDKQFLADFTIELGARSYSKNKQNNWDFDGDNLLDYLNR